MHFFFPDMHAWDEECAGIKWTVQHASARIPSNMALASEYDIEFRYQEIGLGRRGRQLYNQCFRIRDTLQKPVLGVIRIALKIHLRNQFIAFTSHIKMDVGRPDHAGRSRVMQRFYGFELVAAIGACRYCAKSLEIGIERCWVRVIRVGVASRGIGLPDFDISARDRAPRWGRSPGPGQ
jgi:hypothetical protein